MFCMALAGALCGGYAAPRVVISPSGPRREAGRGAETEGGSAESRHVFSVSPPCVYSGAWKWCRGVPVRPLCCCLISLVCCLKYPKTRRNNTVKGTRALQMSVNEETLKKGRKV